MNQFELIAEPREDVGRGASRRLRRAGRLPGIIYGADKEATAVSLDHDKVVHQLEVEAFYSHILTVKIGKEKQKVVLKDLQRHPYKTRLLHIDLQRISESEELTMRVPIHFLNEDKCVGVKQNGGVISHIMTEIEVTCLPKDLPEYIEIDLHNLDVGDAIHLSEISFPEGVTSYALAHGGDASAPVVSVHMPRAVEEEEPEEAEELELAEAEAAAERGEKGEKAEESDKDEAEDKDGD